MASVHIRGVHKHFGTTHVIRGVDVDIADGEFAVLAMLPPVFVVVVMQKLFVRGLVETEK